MAEDLRERYVAFNYLLLIRNPPICRFIWTTILVAIGSDCEMSISVPGM